MTIDRDAEIRHYIDQGYSRAQAVRIVDSDWPKAAEPEPEPVKPAASGPSQFEMRAWARASGFQVPARGSLPKEVREAWDAAHLSVSA